MGYSSPAPVTGNILINDQHQVQEGELLQEGDCQIICYLQFLNIKQGEVGTSEKNFSWEFLESLANTQQLLIQNPLKWHAKSVCVCVLCVHTCLCVTSHEEHPKLS